MLIFEVNPATEPVFADYLLLTAGSTKFPPGLPVAKVLESASPEAGKIRTEAIPVADFNRLKLVVVLQWTFSTGDQPLIDEAPVEDAGSETGGS